MRKRYKNLTFSDRQIIEQMIAEKRNPKEIAEVVGVSFQTVYRDLRKGRDADGNYKAEIAQKTLFS